MGELQGNQQALQAAHPWGQAEHGLWGYLLGSGPRSGLLLPPPLPTSHGGRVPGGQPRPLGGSPPLCTPVVPGSVGRGLGGPPGLGPEWLGVLLRGSSSAASQKTFLHF